jgi:hypothetical protein
MMLCSVSPSGRILALTEDYRALLYSSQSSDQPEKQFQFEPAEIPSAWSSDGKSLYLVRYTKTPATITRFEIATGHRSIWKQIPVSPGEAGTQCEAVVISPDGQSYAYTYSNHASDLYLVLGLK